MVQTTAVFIFFIGLLISTPRVHAVEIGEIEIFADRRCETNVSDAIPFIKGDTCINTFGGGSKQFVCATNTLELFSEPNCSSISGLTITTTLNGCLDGVELTCAEFPDDQTITISVGPGCGPHNSTDMPLVRYAYALLVNACRRLPNFDITANSGIGTQYYMAGVTVDGSVTVREFNNTKCSGSPVSTLLGKLHHCVTITVSGEGTLSRLLTQADSVAFDSAAPGATIQTTNSAVVSTVHGILVLILASSWIIVW